MSRVLRQKARHALFKRVRDKRKHFLAFVQQEHDSEVTQPLIPKARTGYELQAFHLAEVGLRAEHVDIEQLGDIVVSGI